MPTYEWHCNDCSSNFELIRSMQEYSLPASCDACHSYNTTRLISRTSFYGAGDWDKASFNPGLGCIVKNSKHRAQIAKERGLIEVGNEDCDKISNSQDAKLESNIDQAMKPVYDSVEHGIKEHYLRK